MPHKTSAFRRNLQAAWRCVRNAGKDFGAVECIHGHFMPLQFRALRLTRKARFVTWLRDPVQRLVSHYHYLQRMPADGPVGGLQRRLLEENWSLERFCLCREMRNFYSQYFWGFPLPRFDFVGVVEWFDEDFQRFEQDFLGATLPVFAENVNAEKQNPDYVVEPELRRQIEACHHKDVALYRWALEQRARSR